MPATTQWRGTAAVVRTTGLMTLPQQRRVNQRQSAVAAATLYRAAALRIEIRRMLTVQSTTTIQTAALTSVIQTNHAAAARREGTRRSGSDSKSV